MTKLGKLWTASVAYVSLIMGAGLSVAGNLADTHRIRGHDMDVADVVLAVWAPIFALLAVELFVSPWPRRWSMQALRWVGLSGIGILATVVSWSHIHELLLARGQNDLVATLSPVAIDGLAVMATASILATRGQGSATATDSASATATDSASATDTDRFASMVTSLDTDTAPPDVYAAMPDPLATRPGGDLSAWEAGYERALDTVVAEARIADRAEEFLSAVASPDVSADSVPVAPGHADSWPDDGHGHPAEDCPDADMTVVQPRTRTACPDSVRTAVMSAVTEHGLSAVTAHGHPVRAEIIADMVTGHAVSARTARRWLAMAINDAADSGHGEE